MKASTIIKRMKVKASEARRLRRLTLAEIRGLKKMVRKFPKKEVEFYADRIIQIVGDL